MVFWLLAGGQMAVLAADAGTTDSQSVVLAEKGIAKAVIVTDQVYADRQSPDAKLHWRQILAANDLKHYLDKITGAEFRIVEAGTEKPEDTCIYINNAAAAKLGLDPATLAGEEWFMRLKDGDLCLAGGKRDGFLWAVYQFLENDLGVRWWSPEEEFVPSAATLSLSAGLDRQGKPAFDGRVNWFTSLPEDSYQLKGWYMIRNRMEYSAMVMPDGSAVRHAGRGAQMAQLDRWPWAQPDVDIESRGRHDPGRSRRQGTRASRVVCRDPRPASGSRHCQCLQHHGLLFGRA